MNDQRLMIFVSGPYTQPPGHELENTQEAMRAGLSIFHAGHLPVVPHLYHWFDEFAAQEGGEIDYEDYMAVDLRLVEACDVLLRLPGHSSGGDREVAHAHDCGIPVYYDLDFLIEELLEEAA